MAQAKRRGLPFSAAGRPVYANGLNQRGLPPSLESFKEIGAIATPDIIQWAPGLPKTRSGKIMRRILRKIAEGVTDKASLGDTTTLADPTVVDALVKGRQ